MRIAISGNIAAGKTSLSRALGNLLSYKVIIEESLKNPYTIDFVSKKQSAMLHELWYLKENVKSWTMEAKKEKNIIIERTIWEQPLFAKRLLRNHDLEMYLVFYNYLEKLTINPDVIIFLKAEPLFLKERSKRRNIKRQDSIVFQNLIYELDKAYEDLFTNNTLEQTVISINVQEVDLCDPEELENLRLLLMKKYRD